MSRARPLVLASSSPRRRDVLGRLGLAFEVVGPPEDAEPPWDGVELPEAFAREAAAAKARAVAGERPEAVVVGADTVVVISGELLGKPSDPAAARRMLARLSGRDHVVHTGVAIVGPGGHAAGVESTTVTFRSVTDDEIERYVGTGEPLDKAGAYGIQGLGAALVQGVRGCYFNVMGFPVARFQALLREAGYEYRIPGEIRTTRDR